MSNVNDIQMNIKINGDSKGAEQAINNVGKALENVNKSADISLFKLNDTVDVIGNKFNELHNIISKKEKFGIGIDDQEFSVMEAKFREAFNLIKGIKDHISTTSFDTWINAFQTLSARMIEIQNSTNTYSNSLEYWQEQQSIIFNQFNEISRAIKDLGNISYTETDLFNLIEKVGDLKSALQQLNGIMPIEEFERTDHIIDQLSNRLAQLDFSQGLHVPELGEIPSTRVERQSTLSEEGQQRLQEVREYQEQEKYINDHLNERLALLGEEFARQSRINEQQEHYVNDMDRESFGVGQTIPETTDQINAFGEALNNAGQDTNNFQVDTEKILGILNNIVSTGKISTSSITGLAGAFGTAVPAIGAFTLAITLAKKAIEVGIEVVKLYIKYLNETIEVCEKIVKVLGSGAVNGLKELTSLSGEAIGSICDGVNLVKDSLENMVDMAQQAIDKLQEFADMGAKIEDSYFNIYTLLGSDVGNQVSGFVDAFSKLNGLDASSLASNMVDIVSAVGSMGLATDDMLGAVENLTVMSQDLSILAGSFEKAQKDLGNTISKGYVGKASALYPIMTKNEIKEIKKLNSETERYNYLMSISSRIKGRYNDYLNTEAGKVAQLRAQYSALTNNIAQIALSLYAKIAPVLTQLLKLANAVVESIIKIFNINIKNSGSTNVGSIAEGIADSMNAVSEATDKAKRKVASFDDVIQLNEDTSNSDSGLGVDPADLSLWDDLIDKEDKVNSKLDDLIEKVKKLFAEGDYYGAGKAIAEYINELLEGIDWDNIRDKANKAGEAVAQFINGFLDTPDLFANIGTSLAQSVNTIFEFLNGFVTELDWVQLGQDLILAWSNFWNTLDTDLMADTVYKAFMGIVTVVSEWISGGGLLSMTEAIGNFLISLFGSFTDEDVKLCAETLVNFIGNVFDSLELLIEKFKEHPELLDKLKLFITTLFTNLSNNSSEWGNTLGTTLYNIFMLAMESMSAWLDGGGFDSLVDFITSTITSFFDGLTEEDINLCVDNIIKFIQNVFNNLDKITELLQNDSIKEKIKQLITGLMDGFVENAGDWGESLNNLIMTILDTAKELLEHADENGLSDGISAFLEKLDLAELLKEYLKTRLTIFKTTKWPAIWEAIKAFFSLIGDALPHMIELTLTTIISPILGIFNLVKKIVNIFFGDTKAMFKEGLAGIVNGIKYAIDWIVNLIKGLFNKIKQLFSNFSLKSLVNTAFGGVSLGGIVPSIQSAFTPKTRSAIQNVNVQSFETPKIATFNIPRLATGGIVTQSSLVNIGEAGREAVLPLENNTAWMDALASKIADKLNSSSTNGGNITIDMSGYKKEWYNKNELMDFANVIVDALKEYKTKVGVIF